MNNGCDEDGWDLFEEQTRKDFEEYAVRKGYCIKRDIVYSFFYADKRTEEAWNMYHHGHVQGRLWNVKLIDESRKKDFNQAFGKALNETINNEFSDYYE